METLIILFSLYKRSPSVRLFLFIIIFFTFTPRAHTITKRVRRRMRIRCNNNNNNDNNDISDGRRVHNTEMSRTENKKKQDTTFTVGTMFINRRNNNNNSSLLPPQHDTVRSANRPTDRSSTLHQIDSLTETHRRHGGIAEVVQGLVVI